MNKFVHLHLHSQYSLLDSCIKIEELLKKAQQYNMPAIALTDHGNILGALTFYKQAKKAGIKPIVGAELYVAPVSRFEKPDKANDEINYNHLVLLVKDDNGYRNLSELISLSFTEGFYRKPRIDKEILIKYNEGLIALSACFHGEIPFKLLHNREDQAYDAARWYREIFKDNFFIEIQNHHLPKQIEVLPKLVQLAKDLSLPLVATNDVHYLEKEDADVRDVLICIQTNNVLSNPDRPMKKETDEMYFKSGQEMHELFKNIPVDCLNITMDIAGKCNFEFKTGNYFLPQFKVPEDLDIGDYFEKICREGFKTIRPTLLKNKKYPIEVYEKRLDYEIENICKMGFPGYFLIVWDIIRYAHENGIPVGPGRGSVVGSLVAYVMNITAVDPLEYDLLFERFLNPERVSMPDIDIDFDGDLRDRIIKYIRDKYGEENTAQIVTFGKMKAKLALRDIGRVLEIPLSDVNRLAKMIPDGPNVDLKHEIDSSAELQKALKHVPETKRLIDYALRLENNIRHTGMHAAGVVIAPKRLTEFMPLYKTKEDIVTQFEKEEVEEVGLLKMDILGLKTLTIIKNILNEIKEVEGIDIDLQNIPLDDEKTYKVFQDGDTDGIFQFESSGMREYLRRSKPDKITDLIALNALYRPGPLNSGMAEVYVKRKIGKEKVEYLFPELEDILGDSYGIILYQEQVMRISVVLAGFSMGKADVMRKIMGKKQTQKIPAIKKEFMEGASEKKHDKKKLESLFSQMETFAEYGFNKSHSTAYAFLAFQTAYLKAHYPVYFMTANLSSEAEKSSTSSKVIQYISETKKMGIKIVPPDINKSSHRFKVESPTAIRYGLGGLKGVGTAALTSILEARSKRGPFQDYTDFLSRIDMSKVNKSVLESLIQAGALSCFNINRRTLFESIEEVIRQSAVMQKYKAANQRSLFSSTEPSGITIPKRYLEMVEWSENEIIKREKEIAGMYITFNPLDKFRYEILKISNSKITEVEAGEFKGELVRIGGVVTQMAQRKSKKGSYYGELFFEDLSGRMKVLVFKDKWAQLKDEIKEDHPYFLEARLPENEEDSTPNLYLENLVDMETYLKKQARKIIIKLKYEQLTDRLMDELVEKLDQNQDTVPYYLAVNTSDGFRALIDSPPGKGLCPTLSMKKDIESLTSTISVEILF